MHTERHEEFPPALLAESDRPRSERLERHPRLRPVHDASPPAETELLGRAVNVHDGRPWTGNSSHGSGAVHSLQPPVSCVHSLQRGAKQMSHVDLSVSSIAPPQSTHKTSSPF